MRYRLGFAVLSLFFLGTAALWLRLDRSPPGWDDGYYLTNSLILFDALADGGIAGYARQFLTVMGIKPPLIAVLPTPVYLIAGRKSGAAFAVNLAFLLVMFGALYWLGKKYASRRAGLIAMYIAGTIPILYGPARWYLQECGLTAIVSVAICLITEYRRPFLLGAVCGLGLLMKFSFPVYVLIPLLYFAVRERRDMLRPKTLLAFVAPAVALTLPWYLFNFGRALQTALESGSVETARLYKTGDVFSPADIWRYFAILFNVGPVLYFVALPLLLLFFSRYVRPPGKQGLLLCALWGSPLLFLAFGHYRELRYTAPLFPALALALAILADAAIERRGAIAAALACIMLALPLINMVQTSFGVFGNSRFDLGGLLFIARKLDYARMYNSAGWPHAEILDDIYRSATFTGGEKKSLIIGTDSVRFNANNFELAALDKKLPFRVATTAYETELNPLLRLLDSAAYFVYKEGGEPVAPFNTLAADALHEVRFGGRFVELPIARTLPDGGVAHVFIRTGAFPGMDSITDCDVTFDGKLQLAGLSMLRTPDRLEVKYRWRYLKPPGREYWCFTHIVDRQGKVAGYLDHPIQGGAEKLQYRLTEAQKSETYWLRLGVFDRASGERLTITSSDFPLTDANTAAIVK